VQQISKDKTLAPFAKIFARFAVQLNHPILKSTHHLIQMKMNVNRKWSRITEANNIDAFFRLYVSYL
jgi:hypothetical protein